MAATADREILETAVSVPCAQWQETLPEAADLCRRAAHAAFEAAQGSRTGAYRPDTPAEASLVLADDVLVQGLNRDFRGQDQATNVLSFASLDGDGADAGSGIQAPVLLGDVVVAYGTAAAEAAAAGKSLADHLSHLVVHGMLHLLGYDHEARDDAEKMEAMEVRVLENLGVANPYPDRADG